MLTTRTGCTALTVLLTLSVLTLVGCSAAATDEPRPSAAPFVTATVEPPSADVSTPTAQASIPELADVAPALVVFDGSTDVDAVDYPASMTAAELAHAREWVQTNVITAQCMGEKGYDYTFVPNWAWSAEPSWIAKLPAEQQAAAGVALDGPRQTPGDYRWEDAGCWGYAVHVMGNDDAH
ncbi:hypothetical protein [Microterricola viridarii]|uniref:Uncharacterized protein n=1 Tax=Microterricola viridarii TaxID=412690 RepID=A0A1H1URU3_9MICO|nr:hypothetical protein [Microterricola viridarii]SDS75177.1 hypothetical protein SAMN04489834_2077 [Microterricola viridarii]